MNLPKNPNDVSNSPALLLPSPRELFGFPGILLNASGASLISNDEDFKKKKVIVIIPKEILNFPYNQNVNISFYCLIKVKKFLTIIFT